MMEDETSVGDILLGDVTRLVDVLSRDAVTKVAKSFFALVGLPVCVMSAEGELLADVHRSQALCRYLNTSTDGATKCAATVALVRDLEPKGAAIVHPCFTGAVYRIVPLTYQGRPIGRFIIGPYVPSESNGPPATLASVEGTLDPGLVRQHYDHMPRVREDIAQKLCDHLKAVIELLVFSGHREQLASTMQAASVRENHRELAQKNEALQESYEELRQLDKLKSTFLATVSHELRTPLTSIIGYAEMLESGAAGTLSDGQAELLRTIRGKADELLGLISSLLDLGRLESRSLELNREPIDVRALLSGIGSTIVPAVNRRNITLDIQIAEATPKIWGDPVRLRQIMLNLTDNAVKFTNEGGAVTLSAERGDLEGGGPSSFESSLFSNTRPAVVLRVQDTGIGIADEELTKIFDAFYQVDAGTTRSHSGAGLGLSIVKQLVDGHEGKIEVASEVGKGTLVSVTLPAVDDDA
jgi:two-component system sensor histidine kinase BarA